MVDAPGAVDLVECDGDVEFRDVEFAYVESASLFSALLDLHLRPGETVALVGRTGSGKSTVVAPRCPRFYDVSGGSMLIDGTDVRDFTIASLRSHIGMVTDEPFLFSESIARRTSPSAGPMRRSKTSRPRRERPARTTSSWSSSDGYDTVIGERGYTLSGGQRQRIAIARTLARQPAHPDPRRRDQRDRRPARVRDPRRAAHADAGAHHADHRPPALDDQPRRPCGGARRRSHRRRRHATPRLMRDVPLYREILAHGEAEYERRARGGDRRGDEAGAPRSGSHELTAQARSAAATALPPPPELGGT